MEPIQYIGEHLWPGRIGHLAVILSFVAGLLAAISYFTATQRRNEPDGAGWLRIARGAFAVHGLGVLGVIGAIFFAMTHKYFEYQYVQTHVSDDLPFKYIFAAFWEGQEGSFLLWMFWHVVLGLAVVIKAGKWESPVMAVLTLVQVFIATMILGIYIGLGDDPLKIGSNPTLLLREVMDAPIFAKADYATLIKGNGLNPLLQNYWMTIHPPTLFLGFASTTVPFAFAIAGLWIRQHTEWFKAALPWALFSGAILGTGILMGGAWAYEALSFGGYWAWDPVENMSLVPWLVLIGGIHTNLVAKSTNHAIRSTYVYYLLSFILVLYSTFLTRSGILGDTSVHAFTEMGLEWQLVIFIGVFTLISGFLLATRYKGIPAPKKEEPVASKEFWMFIGTLVLLFSAVIITGSTSLPVYNKILKFFDPTFEGKVITDPIPHYNKYQIWISVFVGLLSGITQFLRYREFNWSKQTVSFIRHTGITMALAAALSFLTTFWIKASAWQYGVMLFCGWFALLANLDYFIFFLKGNLKIAGSAFSHMGFGIMVIGILASGLNKHVISSNPFVMDGLIEGADEASLRNNILLFKGSPMVMNRYEVTYVKDTTDKFTRTYTVNYKRRNNAGKVTEEFNLHPNILYDKSFSKIAASNPSTKRYFNRDVFTHIASLPQVEMDMEFKQQHEDSLHYKRYELVKGRSFSFLDTVPIRDRDTFVIKRYTATLQDIIRNPTHPDYKPEPGDFTVGAKVQIKREDDDSTFMVEPVLVLRQQLLYAYPVQINQLSTKVRLNSDVFSTLFPDEEKLGYQQFELKQGDSVRLGNLQVSFAGFNKKPENPAYSPQANDIAVSAVLNVRDESGKEYNVEPVYMIRDNQPFNLKDEVLELGFHARFVSLNPTKETATLYLANTGKKTPVVPIEVATDSLRSDYIVLEAIEFPGINLFWIGASLMMIGLAVSLFRRLSTRYA